MKTKKMCLWCKYFVMEYRKELLYPHYGKPFFYDTLWIGCTKGPVEKIKKHDDCCDEFVWDIGGTGMACLYLEETK